MKKFSYLLAISLIAGSILTGCGNGSDNDTTTPSASTTPGASTTPSTTPGASTTPSTTPGASTTPSTTPSPSTTPVVADGECPGYLPC